MTKALRDKFGQREALKRFEAALRGARIAGHKSMADVRGEKPKKSKPKSPRKK